MSLVRKQKKKVKNAALCCIFCMENWINEKKDAFNMVTDMLFYNNSIL